MLSFQNTNLTSGRSGMAVLAALSLAASAGMFGSLAWERHQVLERFHSNEPKMSLYLDNLAMGENKITFAREGISYTTVMSKSAEQPDVVDFALHKDPFLKDAPILKFRLTSSGDKVTVTKDPKHCTCATYKYITNAHPFDALTVPAK